MLLKYGMYINLPKPIDTSVFEPFDKDKTKEL